MPRIKRTWNKDFVDYTKFIVKHNNYKDMPEPLKKDGTPRWIVSGNSSLGEKRAIWWDKKVSEMKLSNRAEVARAIHPKELGGLKPCQICGKKLSIYYVYPNKTTLSKLNKEFGSSFEPYQETIDEILKKVYTSISDSIFPKLAKLFNISSTVKPDIREWIMYIKDNCKNMLSPGVMSNPPDRFEGFHTYNACCRSKEDTGRHVSNLARYSQDRRAYENWAEGNWNLSNRLMGEFKRYGKRTICPGCGRSEIMTPDHIGPISLGFTHRPKFNPLCNSCNSGKNNRMSLEDVKTLIDDEKNGEKVISWHSKFLWDSLKRRVSSDSDALNLSKIMREHLHNVLSLLALLYSKGYKKFLMKFLHPEYSFVDYKFENFYPFKLYKLKVIRKEIGNKNKTKNSLRYLRISFESLKDYISKDNRHLKQFVDNEIKKQIDLLLDLLRENKEGEAYRKLNSIITEISKKEIAIF